MIVIIDEYGYMFENFIFVVGWFYKLELKNLSDKDYYFMVFEFFCNVVWCKVMVNG